MSGTLSEVQLLTLAAAMDRILPGEDGPGASSANAVGYVRWLLNEDRNALGLSNLESGLMLLDTIAGALWQRRFVICDAPQRDLVLRRIEGTPHPAVQRFLHQLVDVTLVGFLCPPEYGGNRDRTGWQYLGYRPHVAVASAEGSERIE